MLNIIKAAATVLAALIVAAVLMVSALAYSTYHAASVRLAEFKQLATAKNPTTDFETLRRKYGTKLHPLEGCTPQLCQYEIDLSNKPLSRSRVVPYTEMNIWFTVYKGSLQWAMLEYRTALEAPNSPAVHVEEGMCNHGCGVRFDVNPHGTSEQMWNGLVSFDTRATPQQRDAALGLNVGCFLRIGGCKDITDLLPTMWGYADSGKISSRLVGLSQTLEESHALPTPDDF